MQTMNKLALACVCAGASASGMAQEVGRVLSAQPVLQQIAVPRQVCTSTQVAVQPPKSGAGALMGALAGGAVGNQVGQGAGNAAATMLGILGGAMLGDRIEGAPDSQMQTVQHCGTETRVETRTVAYNVVYDYAGKQYTVQTPNDPGPTIALQISPVGSLPGAGAPSSGAQAPTYPPSTYPPSTYLPPTYVHPGYAQPIYQAPVYPRGVPHTVYIATPPSYPVVVARPYGPRYVPPVSFQFGWSNGGGKPGGHRHGRDHGR